MDTNAHDRGNHSNSSEYPSTRRKHKAQNTGDFFDFNALRANTSADQQRTRPEHWHDAHTASGTSTQTSPLQPTSAHYSTTHKQPSTKRQSTTATYDSTDG